MQPLRRAEPRRGGAGRDTERGAGGSRAARPLHDGTARLAAAHVRPGSREMAASDRPSDPARLGTRKSHSAGSLCPALAPPPPPPPPPPFPPPPPPPPSP